MLPRKDAGPPVKLEGTHAPVRDMPIAAVSLFSRQRQSLSRALTFRRYSRLQVATFRSDHRSIPDLDTPAVLSRSFSSALRCQQPGRRRYAHLHGNCGRQTRGNTGQTSEDVAILVHAKDFSQAVQQGAPTQLVSDQWLSVFGRREEWGVSSG